MTLAPVVPERNTKNATEPPPDASKLKTGSEVGIDREAEVNLHALWEAFAEEYLRRMRAARPGRTVQSQAERRKGLLMTRADCRG
jgi:hypothetical protein